MSTQLIQRYREAETRYREKFDRVPVFIGMFKPAIKGEEYIKDINKAIASGVPLNKRKNTPSYLLDKNIKF
jgi:hypothetical protein